MIEETCCIPAFNHMEYGTLIAFAMYTLPVIAL